MEGFEMLETSFSFGCALFSYSIYDPSNQEGDGNDSYVSV